MTIRTEYNADGSMSVALDTTDDWAEFAALNLEALMEQYGSAEKALRHLLDGGLVLGGGAAPMVNVYFDEGGDFDGSGRP